MYFIMAMGKVRARVAESMMQVIAGPDGPHGMAEDAYKVLPLQSSHAFRCDR
jgi:hypothetical protein